MTMATISEQVSPGYEDMYQKFRNIDEAYGYEICQRNLRSADTHNFVVEFSDAEARCVTDLTTEDIKILLKAPRSPATETRWINFWGGDLAKESIKAIVDHYGLAPRLLSLLCSKASDKYTEVRTKERTSDQASPKCTTRTSDGSSLRDVEKATSESNGTSRTSVSDRRPPINVQDITFGDIVDDIWHFCSVDWGHRYLHVGYNSLFYIPDIEVRSGPDKPTGKRIWTSLVLCADGTVISVSEKAFPGTKVYPEILKVVRRNTLNVFSHLSRISKTNQNELMTVNIRNFDAKSTENSNSGSLGSSGLLFYYLIDDWMTSYS